MKHLLLIFCLAVATHSSYAEQKAPPSKPTAAAPGPDFSGKVTETMNTAGYTYVLLDDGKQQVWAAAVQFNVKKGDTVAIKGGMAMEKYHSKTLNRDFDLVYFASDLQVNGKSPNAETAELPAGHPPIGGTADSNLPKGHPALPAANAAPEKVDSCCVKKVDGGKTVQEIQADRTKLKGKPIAVRGKVVKYNSGIMGKNWLHIQDGTGKPGQESLVVTTDADVKVGDTVLVNGNVSIDRDFGYGYKYEVIVENAKVTVE